MAHSVELLFDARTEAAIRAAWQILADAGLPSQNHVKSATNRPHVTLLAAPRISPEVDDVLRELRTELPLDCIVGTPLVFTGRHQSTRGMTLARLIVPSTELLALHERVYALTLPHVTGEPFAHSAPGHWTPHATLGRRFGADEIGAALAAIRAEVTAADLVSGIVGLRRWDSDQRIDQILVG